MSTPQRSHGGGGRHPAPIRMQVLVVVASLDEVVWNEYLGMLVRCQWLMLNVGKVRTFTTVRIVH
jgi:hypothetical protein